MELPTKLKDNEYLLKIRPNEGSKNPPIGFLSKYTQKGLMPVSFDEWGVNYYYGMEKPKPLPITIHIEEFKPGWKIFDWRIGKSQQWAQMVHPDGFIVEIYLEELLDIIEKTTIKKGVLEGEYKWEPHKLIKKK